MHKIVDTETYLRFQYKRDAHAVWDAKGGHAAHLDPNFNRQMAFTQAAGSKQPPGPWSQVTATAPNAEADSVVVSVQALLARTLVPDLLSRLPPANPDLQLRLDTCGSNVLRFMGHQLRAAACQQEIKLCEARVAEDPTFMHIVVDFKVRHGCWVLVVGFQMLGYRYTSLPTPFRSPDEVQPRVLSGDAATVLHASRGSLAPSHER